MLLSLSILNKENKQMNSPLYLSEFMLLCSNVLPLVGVQEKHCVQGTPGLQGGKGVHL